MRSPISLLYGLRLSLLLRWILLLPPIDIIISNPTTLAAVVWNFLVVGLRIGGDYIPGMEEAGEKTENAQGNIYKGVSGAKATFDPDW